MFDAEIIYNLIELYLLEKRYRKAQGLIKFFKEHQEDMEYYDKKPAFYDAKIQLFQAFLKTYMQKRLQSSSTS